jgi:hypothetical protein
MSTHNTDSTIEVGDLVRVVAPSAEFKGADRLGGHEFIVNEIWRGDYMDQEGRGFHLDELTIMKPKAELESVYECEKELEEKKDKCYELCSLFITGRLSYEYGGVVTFLDNLQQLIDED